MLSGIFAGALARRSFTLIWRAFEDGDPPEPDQRRVRLSRLALALAIEGAVFRLVRGLVDHLARRGFADVTGRWPGDTQPDGTE